MSGGYAKEIAFFALDDDVHQPELPNEPEREEDAAFEYLVVLLAYTQVEAISHEWGSHPRDAGPQ